MKILLITFVVTLMLSACNQQEPETDVKQQNLANAEQLSETIINAESSAKSEKEDKLYTVTGKIEFSGLCGAHLNLPEIETPRCANTVDLSIALRSSTGEKIKELTPDENNTISFNVPAGRYAVLVSATLITQESKLTLDITQDKSFTIHLQSKLAVR